MLKSQQKSFIFLMTLSLSEKKYWNRFSDKVGFLKCTLDNQVLADGLRGVIFTNGTQPEIDYLCNRFKEEVFSVYGNDPSFFIEITPSNFGDYKYPSRLFFYLRDFCTLNTTGPLLLIRDYTSTLFKGSKFIKEHPTYKGDIENRFVVQDIDHFRKMAEEFAIRYPE